MVPVHIGPRRDFVLFGRLAPYKNIPIALHAWRDHRRSADYRGDSFLILGDGPPGWAGSSDLPEGCEWRRGRYGYQDVLPVLSAAKGSLVHYRSASQSGVQLLSMQLGVATVVSNCGGLPEFQPPGNHPLDMDDVEGLTAWLGALADPAEADHRGTQTRAHFNQFYAAKRSVAALETVLRRTAEPT
jgi:glycosyltransferase involved in cell wall biosynthesis